MFKVALSCIEICVGKVLALTLVSSDSFFDLPPGPDFCISSITEWRKDIPNPTVAGEDFPFSSDFQDMTSSDLFDLKDTVSECSMDSAYQSQSGASRHGARMEPFTQENGPAANAKFVGSNMFSPSLSSETYNTFEDHTLGMNQMQHPTGTWDAPEDSIVYANYSAAQDYSQYATTNVPQYAPTSNASISSPWVSTEAQFHNNQFNFAYPAGQSPTEMMFSTTTPQRPWHTQNAGQERPTAVRSSSSYTLPQDSRRTSAHDATFGAFAGTPTSTTSIHFPQHAEFDQSRLMVSR